MKLLVHHLVDELAGFRRRALVAEARARELEEASGDSLQPGLRQRLSQLERENTLLRERLEAATSRAEGMLDRVRFLRQQVQGEQRS
ncbi:MAG TPA: hypothetical protein VJU87_12995 [Gemmatimonadaceae bacterium]|nr:hypothetical protein [Gemmatimonadaceae bacterium]